MFFSFGGCVLLNSSFPGQNGLQKFSVEKSGSVRVRAVIKAQEREEAKSVSYRANVIYIDTECLKVFARGAILLKLNDKGFNYAAGDIVDVKGYFRRQRVRSAGFKNISHTLVAGPDDVRVIGQNKRFLIQRFSQNVSGRLKADFFKYLSPPVAAFYSALLLGKNSPELSLIKSGFIKSGNAHILAISGLHVGIIAGIFLLLSKIFIRKRKLRYCLCILFLWFFAFLTGMRPPVVRAAIMASLIMAGIISGRTANIYNSLSLAALIILLKDPGNLFEAGFELSFAAVLGIVSFYDLFYSFFKRLYTRKNRLILFFAALFCVSLSANIFTLPIVLYHFKSVALFSVPASLLALPLVSLLVCLGIFLLIAGVFFPFLAPVVALPAGIAASVLISFNSFVSSIPGAYLGFDLQFSAFGAVFYYALLLYIKNKLSPAAVLA